MKNALVRSVFANRTVPAVKVARKMKNAGNVVEKTPKIVVTIIISITASNIGITDGVAVVEGVVDSDSQSVQTPSFLFVQIFPIYTSFTASAISFWGCRCFVLSNSSWLSV